ncbi:efflux RND transporter periplasmic adaptor subunit [Eoetvoesiella caeni]
MSFDDVLFNAESRCRSALSFQSLAFVIANETWQAFDYRQAQVWRKGAVGPDLLAVSGLATLAEDSPFTVWAKRLMRKVWPLLGETVHALDLAAIEAQDAAPPDFPGLTPDVIDGWDEWWPAHLLLVPLVRDGECLGVALFLRDDAPDARCEQALARLQSTWSYCAWAVAAPRKASVRHAMPEGRWRWGVAVALALLLMVPIRETALAPAEIIALKGVAIAAPIDGVIKNFDVVPNQLVKAGALLFSLDDTTLRNRREVTARSLEVAAAELLSAQQRAFSDSKASSEVAVLQGRIAERRAELRAVEEQLRRVNIVAPRDGIAVFGDVNDWQGRPVTTGERVMQVADPNDLGVMMYLPVADAITLDEGADMRVFLHVAPLSPVKATLTQTSYQSVLSPDGVASYRVRGTLEPGGNGVSRIGLKGTAKVYGDSVPLVYYLLRRPLASLRERSGL